MEHVYWQENDVHLEDYTLILPAVSHGNVGQLAIDLLLKNLDSKSIAYIHHPCFLPMIGTDPYDSNLKNPKLSTSCQLYECKDKKLAIIQIRALFNRCKVNEFKTLMTNFIKENKIRRTIMLCGSYSAFFTPDDLEGIDLFYSCSEYSDEEFKEFPWKPFAIPDNVYVKETNPIPGGGIAKYFLEDCKSQNIPLVVLILVCSEGYNCPEAFHMVEQLNKWLHLKPVNEEWKEPISWALPYGRGPKLILY